MAVTQITNIRYSVEAAINYILDPKKTDGKLLVSAYATTPETAVNDFSFTASLGTRLGCVKAQHVIQSFKPGEVDADTAHEIGKRLALRLTGGKHEYVLCTHIDKAHIHNHIIFNQVDFLDHKKFRSNIRAQRDLMRYSDELCASYGLSVIKDPQGKKVPYHKYVSDAKSPSFKSMLMADIDSLIPSASSFDELVKKLSDKGYEVKFTGTYYSFRAPLAKKFTRLKRLGDDYTYEGICKRLESASKVNKDKAVSSPSFKVAEKDFSVSSFMEKMQNPAYANKVALGELKKLSASYAFLNTHGIDSISEISDKRNEWIVRSKDLRKELKGLEDEISRLNEIHKLLELKDKHKAVYKRYMAYSYSNDFMMKNSSAIISFESACRALKAMEVKPSTSTLEVASTLKELNAKHAALIDSYHLVNDDIKKLNTAFNLFDELALLKGGDKVPDIKMDKVVL